MYERHQIINAWLWKKLCHWGSKPKHKQSLKKAESKLKKKRILNNMKNTRICLKQFKLQDYQINTDNVSCSHSLWTVVLSSLIINKLCNLHHLGLGLWSSFTLSYMKPLIVTSSILNKSIIKKRFPYEDRLWSLLKLQTTFIRSLWLEDLN